MRQKKKGLSKMAKTIPLSVAVAAISSGALFANAAQGDVIAGYWVEDGSTRVWIEAGTDNTSQKQLLKDAFLGNRSIVIVDEEDNMIEFGKNATSGVALDEMWGNPDYAFTDDVYIL